MCEYFQIRDTKYLFSFIEQFTFDYGECEKIPIDSYRYEGILMGWDKKRRQ